MVWCSALDKEKQVYLWAQVPGTGHCEKRFIVGVNIVERFFYFQSPNTLKMDALITVSLLLSASDVTFP
jgi:hypothetical protein